MRGKLIFKIEADWEMLEELQERLYTDLYNRLDDEIGDFVLTGTLNSQGSEENYSELKKALNIQSTNKIAELIDDMLDDVVEEIQKRQRIKEEE